MLYDAVQRLEPLSMTLVLAVKCCSAAARCMAALACCLCALKVLCCRCQVEELRKELRSARVRSESLSGVAKDKSAKIRALEEQLALTVTNVKVGWLHAVVGQLALQKKVGSTTLLLCSPTRCRRMF